jgi:hypothetical protein
LAFELLLICRIEIGSIDLFAYESFEVLEIGGEEFSKEVGLVFLLGVRVGHIAQHAIYHFKNGQVI